MGDPRGYRLLEEQNEAAPPQPDGGRGFYRPDRTAGIDGIVVRVTPTDDTAERRAAGYVQTNRPGSVHAIADADGVVPMLPDEYVAIGAGENDETSLSVELLWPSGDPDACDAAMEIAAGWCAERIDPHAIAIRHCTVAEWEEGRSGLIGIDELGVGGGVEDFPWEEFLDLIRAQRKRRWAVAAWWRRKGTAGQARFAAAVGALVVVVGGVIALFMLQGDDGEPDAIEGTATLPPATTAPTTAVPTTAPPTTAPATTAAPTTTVPPTTTSTTTSTTTTPPTTTTTTLGPITTAPELNLTGAWVLEIDVTGADAPCAEEIREPPYVRPVFILHEGKTVGVVGLGDGDETWEGTFDGNAVIFAGDRSEDGGTTEARFELQLAEVDAVMIGVEIWSWFGPAAECPNGFSTVTAIRDLVDEGGGGVGGVGGAVDGGD
ncbi:MAG: hypothetical protein ACR2O6_09680 [Ilumatobacteraceae bacterium]